MRRAMVAALMICLAGRGAGAQEAASTIVFGTVRNVSGVVIAGADVWIEGTDRRVVSNDSGEFHLDRVPSGRVKVMVRRLGFQPDSKKLSLQTGDTRQVKFVLEGLVEELEAVIVTAREGASGRMQEFWARRMVGIGVFITRAEIERRHPPRTADLFQQVMGVHVVSGGNGESTRLVTGRQSVSATALNRSIGSGGCQMQYYVDGIFMTPGTFTVDEITPDMIEAVEVFRGPSETPARFRQRDTACGLVVIWTREPPRRPKPDPLEERSRD